MYHAGLHIHAYSPETEIWKKIFISAEQGQEIDRTADGRWCPKPEGAAQLHAEALVISLSERPGPCHRKSQCEEQLGMKGEV